MGCPCPSCPSCPSCTCCRCGCLNPPGAVISLPCWFCVETCGCRTVMPCACCAIGCDGCCIMPKDEKEYWRSTYPCGLMGCVPCCGKWGAPKCLKKGKKED